MTKQICIALMVLITLTHAARAQAQEILPSSSDAPIEITADESLEWRRAEQIFVARKNAVATQGETSVFADILTANYREKGEKNMDIYRLTASGNVAIKSRGSAAYGDTAVYDVDKAVAIMTGKNLRMISEDQVVTAKDSFEYWVNEGRIDAITDATITSGEDRLRADKISATLKENQQGKRVLDTVEAFDNVVITTPVETIRGAYGIYRADRNEAELTGGVTITRGKNILEGERAIVDLTNNTSRLFGNPQSNERVRGLFYPGSTEGK